MTDKVVQDKAKAVADWCKNATEHELQHKGKEWVYLLIPHNDVGKNMTFEGLRTKYIYNN
ncbi:hypothetical protein [Rossellomorea sp. BNER]|uniref:hypothetical protein n=1 Tax=Rossellomorea sp. BNER TaxID=2962031 RepID=UPI003AF2BAE0|nr:hypothetical protein [Rossellomorea sp. BNER]